VETLPRVGAGQDLACSPRARVLVLGKQLREPLKSLLVVVGNKDVQVRRVQHNVLGAEVGVRGRRVQSMQRFHSTDNIPKKNA